jgi:hypothetical protein
MGMERLAIANIKNIPSVLDGYCFERSKLPEVKTVGEASTGLM